MRKLLTLTILATTLLSAPAKADQWGLCYSLSEVAATMMTLRQLDASPTEIIILASSSDRMIRPQMLSLADSVLQTPIYQGTAAKGAVVAVFKERAMNNCMMTRF